MIIRILGEGQWQLADDAVSDLNTIDDQIEQAVGSADQDALTTALGTLHDQVRTAGTTVPDDSLEDSDLILPGADATLAEVEALLADSTDGLIPG